MSLIPYSRTPSFRFGILFGLAILVTAAGEERSRVICDPENPQKQCPFVDCLCSQEVVEVTFDGDTASNLTVDATRAGQPLTITVMLDTKSAPLQGWSYGVAHDETVLLLEEVTLEDTDAKKTFRDGFHNTTLEQVETCLEPKDRNCAKSRPGGGWISALVLSLTSPAELPLGRNSLAKATYVLEKLPGQAGTRIEVTDRLLRAGSALVLINLTVDGKSRRPSKVIDGFIEPEPPECPETALYFGSEVSRADLRLEEEQVLPIVMRHHEPAVGFTLAVKTPLEEDSLWEFSSGSLGQEPDRLIALEIVGASGETRTPWIPNRAVSAGQGVARVERGSALLPLEGRDFLVYDLTPAMGGPGFIVGYLTDLAADAKAMIPVPSGGDCAVSEILRVTLGDTKAAFRRGDGDGNGRISILDAILALPIGRRLPSAVDCDDAFDADDDGRQTIRDVIVIIQYVFQGGRAFPQPFPACGPDPTNDPRECAAFTCP